MHMFWADELLGNRKGDEWVNDAWTPSGIVHMGGLKGPMIHDVLSRILKDKKVKTKYTFGFDDMDPIDGLPQDLHESHEKYMGMPIYIAPGPDGKGTFGEYYSNKMSHLFKLLGIEAEIYLAHEYYKKGIYNDAIKLVLDNSGKVRKVYEEMYKKSISNDWYPFQIICPECGKLGTTKVVGWDGKEVEFVCSEDLVKWAHGCGAEGRISPFNGNGKIPFKVEWAAKWWVFGVTIEGAGKDHASAGGTYDVARKIVKDVFGKDPPLKLPYEFFLSHGRKMSSSKGLGLTGEELLEVLPAELVRFLMIKNHPNRAVEFEPKGTDIIPKLYDDYQKAADAYFEKTDEDLARIFELSQIGEVKKPPSVRFSALAQWVQMPNMSGAIKKENAEEWAKYARVWIEKFAPESEKFVVSESLPELAKELTEQQKNLLKKIAEELDKDWDAEEFQTKIYDLGKELSLKGKETFSAIYLSLIGKDHGPKAAWLILSLDKDFVKKRFNETAVKVEKLNIKDEENTNIEFLKKPEIFSIDLGLFEKHPSISVGVALIKGVRIEKTNPDLEKEKSQFLNSLTGLTTQELGQYPEIVSYRNLYKEMGVDWHSRRPSPEALLRRVALNKGLYTINTAVDAYNLVVMKHRVSIGAFDLDKLEFPTVLRFAGEGEEIHLLGDKEPTAYKEGEIAYFDQNGGFNMDFNYRDAKRTAVTESTKNLYINVDGAYDISPKKVEEVLRDAIEIIIKYCGGELEVFGLEKIH